LKAGFTVTLEPPDIIEQLTGVQLFVLFLLQIYLVQWITTCS